MTQMQESKLMRALQLLRESGLTATAIHTPSNTFYKVLNRSESKKQHKPIFHYVYRSQKTHKFVCLCYHGAKDGEVCVHKAAALVAEQGGDIDAVCQSAAQPAPVTEDRATWLPVARPTMADALATMRPVLRPRAEEAW